jgi:translation initiation factor 5B
MGVKISAQNMERTIAGSQLLVVGRRDEREDVGDEIAGEVSAIVRKYLNKDGIGVYVQASTLGSLEALLEFLKKSKIPVSAIGIGPVHKLDVVRASIMLERETKYAMILAFDVDVVPDAERLAKEVGVKIFTAKIIYHLFDAFTAHMEAEKQRKKREAMARCVFPVEFTMLQKFNDEPIILGVQITEGDC